MSKTEIDFNRTNIVIGLTGPFGSGCSTLRKVLEDNFGFVGFAISDEIREEVKGEGKLIDKGNQGWRKVLQEHGDLKRQNNKKYWVERILKRIEKAKISKPIIIDGFRNFGEVEEIRRVYPTFFLVAVYAEKDERWKRVHKDYGGRNDEFEEDDRRDKLEEFEWGQSVQKCVDDADYAFYNNEHLFIDEHGSEEPALEKIQRLMKQQADDFIPLMTGVEPQARSPHPEEIQIAAAYAQSNASTCAKRHVGAVITIGQNGQEFPISVGYNENPLGVTTCFKQGACFKDEDMESKLGALKEIHCFKCGRKYNKLTKPWRCECGESFKDWLHPNRNMELCMAVHAEERAILSLGGRSAEGATLYVTTFPCFQCARLILDAKIKQIVFVEAYPVKETKKFLEEKIKIVPFTGFTARAFFKVFRKVN